MSQLVQGLDGREEQPQHDQIAGGEQPVQRAAGEVVPVHGEENGRGNHDGQPEHRPGPAPERSRQRRQGAQEPLRIDEGNAPGEEAPEPRPPAPPLGAIVALQDLGGVGRNVALEDVARVELGQEADDLVLRGTIVAEPGRGGLPDLLHGAAAVHEADHLVGGGREAMKALGRAVLQHVPRLAAVALTVNARVAAQPGLQPRHPVPGRAEQGAGRHRVVRASRSRAGAAASRSPGASRSRRAAGPRRRSSPPPPGPGASAPASRRGAPRPGSSCAPPAPSTPG